MDVFVCSYLLVDGADAESTYLVFVLIVIMVIIVLVNKIT